MADEPLDPEARALWRRVTETVRPLGRRRATSIKLPLPGGERSEPAGHAPVPGALHTGSLVRGSDGAAERPRPRPGATLTPTLSLKGEGAKKPPAAANTLDATWDKRLRLGTVAPDLTIDLHGYTVAAAHAELEGGLTRAVMSHARLILLVTGRPPPGRSRLDSPLRGVIRASVGDWLHHSRHAGQIAAVRNAHPRHGGAGALYVILRRRREPG